MPLLERPVPPDYRTLMNDIARSLDEQLNGRAKGEDRKVGFALFLFEYGSTDVKTYISNGASRKEMIELMKNQIQRFENPT